MKIRKTWGTIVALAGIGLFSIMPNRVIADEAASLSFKSQYIAPAGYIFSKDPVTYASFTISKNNFYGFLGANFGSKEGLNEIDGIAGYNRDIGKAKLDIAAGVYKLHNFGKDNSNDGFFEFLGTLSFPGISTPRIKLLQNAYPEINSSHKGRDIEFGLNYKKENFATDLAVHYNNEYFRNRTGFSVAQLSANYSFNLRGINITSKIMHQKALDRKDFEDANIVIISASQDF